MTDRVTVHETAVAERPADLLTIIQKVVEGPLNLEKVEVLERLLAMQERVQAQDRKQQFIEAMARLQAKLPQIAKSRSQLNKDGTLRNKYVPIEDIDVVIRPLCEDEGFSVSFDTRIGASASQMILVCHVFHRAGHVETRELPLPIDNNQFRTGGQNVASTITTGRRQLLKLQFNLIERDEDKDFAESKTLDDKQEMQLRDQVEAAGMNLDKFLVYMRVGKLSEIQLGDWDKAQTAIRAKLAEKK